MAYTNSSKFAVKFCAKSPLNSPFNKGEKNPEPPEEPVDGGTLDEAEVLAFSSKKSERKYWREKEGIGANWNRWKKKREERLNKPRTKRNWNL